jgi:hypothetical protein
MYYSLQASAAIKKVEFFHREVSAERSLPQCGPYIRRFTLCFVFNHLESSLRWSPFKQQVSALLSIITGGLSIRLCWPFNCRTFLRLSPFVRCNLAPGLFLCVGTSAGRL